MAVMILPHLTIGEREISFSFSASPGPGGQNVNKVATKATLAFDVAHSPSLTEAQRNALRLKLGNRINADGVLLISAHRHRTQSANRKAALERFVELLGDALRPRRPRRRTRRTHSSIAERLENKARHSVRKQQRRFRGRADGETA